MAEAVIVAAARSPIGRAFKGSLRDLRPADLAASIVRAPPGGPCIGRSPTTGATQLDWVKALAASHTKFLIEIGTLDAKALRGTFST